MDRTPAVSAVLPETFAPVPLLARERGLRERVVALLGAIAIGSLASPAIAASEPGTRVVRCGEESCLRVTGYRDDPASIVSINGRVVIVEGEHRWRVHLPIKVVREWSAPYARAIEISLQNPETQLETIASVDLPIGLLGGVDLASLVVSIR
jgi:hypothetical protein